MLRGIIEKEFGGVSSCPRGNGGDDNEMTTYGPDEILSCPQCDALVRMKSMASGNTFGARYWTDGKRFAPMLSEQIRLVRCVNCLGFYWIDEAKSVGEVPFGVYKNPLTKITEGPAGGVPGNWLDALHIEQIELDGLIEAKRQDVGRTEEETVYIFTQIWWSMNDLVREQMQRIDEGSSLAEPHPLFNEHLQEFMGYLNTSSDIDKLMKAEMLRELGRFGDVGEVLSGVSNEFVVVSDRIKELADERVTWVGEVHHD